MDDLIKRILERIADASHNYRVMQISASPNPQRIYMGKEAGLRLAESIIMDEYNKGEKE